jgi:hypothetical protein
MLSIETMKLSPHVLDNVCMGKDIESRILAISWARGYSSTIASVARSILCTRAAEKYGILGCASAESPSR